MGQQYHGARGPISELTGDYSNPNNIYGGYGTFYTTDATDVAAGYGRNNPNSMMYRVVETQPVNMYDMEAMLHPHEAAKLFGYDYGKDVGLVPSALEEASRYPEHRAANDMLNLREAMDEIRAQSGSEGYSKDDVQELFDNAIYNLQQQGYGGMRHLGGLRTKTEPHNVQIYFDPANQISLEPHVPVSKIKSKGFAVGGRVGKGDCACKHPLSVKG